MDLIDSLIADLFIFLTITVAKNRYNSMSPRRAEPRLTPGLGPDKTRVLGPAGSRVHRHYAGRMQIWKGETAGQY